MCIRYVENYSDRQYWNLQRSYSTSDKRSSSGEMKIDLKRVGIYREMDLTLVKIKDELWSLIFTPCLEVDWSVISVMGKCEVTFAIKSDVWWHVFTYCGVFADEGMTLPDSCQVIKSQPIVFFMKAKVLTLIEQVFCPTCSSWVFGYIFDDVWSKSPNVVKLG